MERGGTPIGLSNAVGAADARDATRPVGELISTLAAGCSSTAVGTMGVYIQLGGGESGALPSRVAHVRVLLGGDATIVRGLVGTARSLDAPVARGGESTERGVPVSASARKHCASSDMGISLSDGERSRLLDFFALEVRLVEG